MGSGTKMGRVLVAWGYGMDKLDLVVTELQGCGLFT